jgi:hypothetical protein
MFRWIVGRKGPTTVGTIQNNLGNFLLLNPDFFFRRQRTAQKAVLVPFFWGGVYDLISNFFFDLRKISVGGVFRSTKFQNLRAIS